MSTAEVHIGRHVIGRDHPVFVIAELSGNHAGSLERAVELVEAAADAGADAVKLQTYTPETMTVDSDLDDYVVAGEGLWKGRRLFELYAEAMTPWEWFEPLRTVASGRGMELFSTPFDATALDYLEQFEPVAYKIASFELIDLPLIRMVAATGRPLLMSTGMATLDEIDAAVETARDAGNTDLVLLRCNSSYPAPVDEMDLRSLPQIADRFGVLVGLSDHTLGGTASLLAVALGGVAIEKHMTLRRADGGPDAEFSLEPAEFAELVRTVREATDALGGVRFGPSSTERRSLAFRRSIRAIADVQEGDRFTEANVACRRPAGGLPPADFDLVLSSRASRPIRRGEAIDQQALRADQPTSSST